MEKAVYEYRQRRQKRLDAKAIEQYKMRRDERLLSRFDDDDDGDKNVGGGKRGGHGNTKIPYGLCQREGIRVQPNWTPKDAWDALAGKGYSAGDVYRELKATGKIGAKKSETVKSNSLKEQIEEIKALSKKKKGVYTPEEISKAGKAAREMLEKEYMPSLEKKISKLKNDFNVLEKEVNDSFAKGVSEAECRPLLMKWRAARKELEEIENGKTGRMEGELVREMISSVRDMGLGKHAIDEIVRPGRKKSPDDDVANSTFENALNYYPTEWVEKMIEEAGKRGKYKVFATSRGYYSKYSSRREIALSKEGGDYKACAIHEMGHYIEHSIPEVLKAEKEFYKKRTEGEKLEWLGSEYDADEKTRRDHFMSPYMGKDYGGKSFELVSMGFEKIYTNYSEFRKKDPEMCEWILGLMMLT